MTENAEPKFTALREHMATEEGREWIADLAVNERAQQRGHGHPEDKTRAARYQALEVLGDALRDWRIHAIAEQHANAVAFSLTACLADMVKALVKEKKIAVENKGLF